MNRRLLSSLLCACAISSQVATAQTPAASITDASSNVQAASADALSQLRARIAEQQEQIKKLQQAVEEQQKMLEKTVANMAQPDKAAPTTADGTTVVAASADGGAPLELIPAVNRNRRDIVNIPRSMQKDASKNPCEAVPDGPAPAFIRLGSTCITPIGFMDITSVWRDKNAGSSIGTNFGSIPYNTSVNAKNSEFRFSPQNSRIGFRVDGQWKDVHFIGYNEFDFLGTGGSTNYTVTNGAFVPRLRLFWVDVRKGPIEFLGGQSWSMLTPNRKGISALPSDLFYSQVIDVNYMAGLTWTRQPGMRILFHPNKVFTAGISAENPDQYIGGSAGGSSIALPTALTSLANTQLDNTPNISVANTVLAMPTVHPDFIAKIAVDPNSRFHFEVAGLARTFKIWNPLAAPANGAGKYFSAMGSGVQVGINGEVVKGLRLISTNFWSDGGGRYLFGQAPDVVVRSDGSLSPVHAGGTVNGFEATVKNTLLYAYYGGIYIGRDVALDANGTSKVGYGYTGSSNSQNRTIQEITFGFNQTIWKNARYGAINAMGQYEWATRNPWYVALGAAKATHDNTIYFNLRYTLPGSMPNF